MVGHINLKDDNSSVLCLLLVSLCLSIGRNHMGDRVHESTSLGAIAFVTPQI